MRDWQRHDLIHRETRNKIFCALATQSVVRDYDKFYTILYAQLYLSTVAFLNFKKILPAFAMKVWYVRIVLFAVYLKGKPKIYIEAVQFETSKKWRPALWKVCAKARFECLSDSGLQTAGAPAKRAPNILISDRIYRCSENMTLRALPM